MRHLLAMATFAYAFFLSIDMLGMGMKQAFKGPVQVFLRDNAESFTELVSFVVGVLGTSLVQSSSTVTSMTVVLAQQEILPMVIAVGIVHGANLGTSVTSSLVAFASEIRPLTGRPFHDLRALLFAPRLPGFHRAVSTAVVHGMFNALFVTAILLLIELPFGWIHLAAERSAEGVASVAQRGGPFMDALFYVSPATYTKPVVSAMLSGASAVGVPSVPANVALVVVSFALLFFSLRGFSRTVKAWLAQGQSFDDSNLDDLRKVGHRLLGRTPIDTFVRGLVLTVLVQSSSATTSMIVPLAALGLFSLRQVFPFILGANIGTTATALIAAAQAFGQPGFAEGMTIALCHFYLNVLAVLVVAVVPGAGTSALGATQWLADLAERTPAWLLAYLFTLVVAMPLVVYALPDIVARAVLAVVVVLLFVGPHVYLRRAAERVPAVDAA